MGLQRTLGRVALAAVLLAAALGWPAAGALAATCAKSDFETVVERAAAALRDLNQKYAGSFQGKLRRLKEKRGWSQDQFVKDGAPFVRDDKIIEFESGFVEKGKKDDDPKRS